MEQGDVSVFLQDLVGIGPPSSSGVWQLQGLIYGCERLTAGAIYRRQFAAVVIWGGLVVLHSPSGFYCPAVADLRLWRGLRRVAYRVVPAAKICDRKRFLAS